MKTIKFRAWDKLTDRMIDWDRIVHLKMLHIFNSEDWVPMQFTGLLDKHDKEIFEGDFLSITDGYYEQIREVKWMGEKDYPAFDLVDWDNGEVNGLSEIVQSVEGFEYEIIGNIYEDTMANLTKTL